MSSPVVTKESLCVVAVDEPSVQQQQPLPVDEVQSTRESIRVGILMVLQSARRALTARGVEWYENGNPALQR